MTLASPAALWLLCLGALVVFLYFLQTRRVRREVSALFLWEDLPSEARARAARFRVRLDIAVVLQLLTLAAAVLALAEPALVTKTSRLDSLAIVLDGSASVRARGEDGSPIADLMRREALAWIDRYSATPVAVFELSTSPRVVAPLGSDRESVRQAVAGWEPGWNADGNDDDLTGVLTSQGLTFERVVLLTDDLRTSSLPNVETVAFSPGENLAITAFSVREDPSGVGSIAFVRLRNDTSADREVTVRVSDGARRVQFPALLSAGDEHALVLPFPASDGTVFTATIDGDDAFPVDDARAFSLAGPSEWRIRVFGTIDRYLRAAIASVGVVRFLDESDPAAADVNVVCGVPLPDAATGAAFLIRSPLAGVVDVGDGGAANDALTVNAPADPLLVDIDPLNFVVREVASVRPFVQGTAVLSIGGVPFLWRATLPERRVVLLAADPVRTNLPLVVDFPLLVRNILRWLVLADRSVPPRAAIVGEPIPFGPYGVPERLTDPSGRAVEVHPDAFGFAAKAPGVYWLTASSGSYAVAVNVAGGESPRGASAEAPAATGRASADERVEGALLPTWPFAAALALVCWILEVARTHGASLPRRRA